MNTYIDCFIYRRAVTGLESNSLLGNAGRLTSAVSAGDTNLQIGPATTVVLNQFDQVTIFDSDTSEVVVAASTVNVGSTSIPLLEPLQFDHAQYTVFCSDGVKGSLADAIVEASNWIENICQQTLFQQQYSAETLKLPTMRASINNRGNLVFRPRHFPVVSDSGIVIESNNSNPVSYDPSQIVLDGAKQVVTVPWLVSVSGSNDSAGGAALLFVPSRQDELFLDITYTAGYTPGSMPGDVRDVAVLLASEILGRRQNPTGANEIRLGDKQLQATAPRDLIGESLLVKTAKGKLQPYSVEAF